MLDSLAPQVGLEPTTLRLTAECSAIELLRSVARCFALYKSSRERRTRQKIVPCRRGPTHVNFFGQKITALIPIDWFGSTIQMIGTHSYAAKRILFIHKARWSFSRSGLGSVYDPNHVAPNIDLEKKLRCVDPACPQPVSP